MQEVDLKFWQSTKASWIDLKIPYLFSLLFKKKSYIFYCHDPQRGCASPSKCHAVSERCSSFTGTAKDSVFTPKPRDVLQHWSTRTAQLMHAQTSLNQLHDILGCQPKTSKFCCLVTAVRRSSFQLCSLYRLKHEKRRIRHHDCLCRLQFAVGSQ